MDHELRPKVVNVFKNDAERLPDENILQANAGPDAVESVESLDDGLVAIRMVDIFESLSKDLIVKILEVLRRKLSTYGVLHIEEPMNGYKNQELIELLKHSGFPNVKNRLPFEDISCYIGHSEDRAGKFLIEAKAESQLHQHDSLLSKAKFKEQVANFGKENMPDVSWVVTVHNEEKNLPHFLSFLENITSLTGMRREFIFVINGCTDNSEKILREFCTMTDLNARVVESEIGILNAYKKGIASRQYNGYIGRFDADLFMHPYTLDLMQMHLVTNKDAVVTYAEPLPLEAPNEINAAHHFPELATKRLYYTGKTHLFREDPYQMDGIRDMPKEFIADDIFVSFYLVYYYGFKSISRTPHAVVYERVVGSFDELALQFSRATSEISRIMQKYPHFKVLDDIVEQKFVDGPYKELTDKAKAQFQYVENWTRLETTK